MAGLLTWALRRRLRSRDPLDPEYFLAAPALQVPPEVRRPLVVLRGETRSPSLIPGCASWGNWRLVQITKLPFLFPIFFWG